jgi:hypothetical protein
METNPSEPPFKCRKRRDVIKTRRESLAWDKSGRNLITDQTVTGMKVVRTSHRLLYGTWEPTPPMLSLIVLMYTRRDRLNGYHA